MVTARAVAGAIAVGVVGGSGGGDGWDDDLVLVGAGVAGAVEGGDGDVVGAGDDGEIIGENIRRDIGFKTARLAIDGDVGRLADGALEGNDAAAAQARELVEVVEGALHDEVVALLADPVVGVVAAWVTWVAWRA